MADYSFIIPAHNAEKTIIDTIGSIEKHFPNAEIIVVENGSSDKTKLVVEECILDSQNIYLYESEKGVSAARNKGIIEATGKWIFFVDADDQWIGSQLKIEELLRKYEDTDLILFGYKKGKEDVLHDYHSMNQPLCGEELTKAKVWMMSRPTIRMTVWGKAFRREFLVSNNLYFDNSLCVSEDSEYLVRCLNTSRSMMISNMVAYDYCLREGSVTRSTSREKQNEYLQALEVVKRDIVDQNPAIRRAFMNYVIAHINLICVHEIFNCLIKKPWSQRVKDVHKLLNHEVVRIEIQKIKLRDVSDIQLLPAFLFKFHWYFLGGFICYLKSSQNRRKYINE